ncbi:MAG: D-aminoacyl-tRNA deacylase [Tissierellia bacterium]|nr:D-aminoacyl-tRNA deacylase [Tissierellia bacterium]
MRAVIQRVKGAKVKVENETINEIDKGFLVLLGVEEDDTDKDLEYICNKTIGLRIFEDENKNMNLSLADVGGEILAISQFTLYGDARKGRRPSFIKAARPEKANPLYEKFLEKCNNKGIKTYGGVFGAHMEIELINDGPVTIILDSSKIL